MKNQTTNEDRFTRLCRSIDRQIKEDPMCASSGAFRRVAAVMVRKKRKARLQKPARATTSTDTQASGVEVGQEDGVQESGGDDAGDGDGDPEPAGACEEEEHSYTRRGLSYGDLHALATFDHDDPAPQIAHTIWPAIPDPYSYHNVQESSWRLLAGFADGRAREVCRLLGEGKDDFELIGEALLCSDHTARDDARKIFEAVVAGQAVRQLCIFDDPDTAYIPKRSTRGRKKKKKTQQPGTNSYAVTERIDGGDE